MKSSQTVELAGLCSATWSGGEWGGTDWSDKNDTWGLTSGERVLWAVTFGGRWRGRPPIELVAWRYVSNFARQHPRRLPAPSLAYQNGKYLHSETKNKTINIFQQMQLIDKKWKEIASGLGDGNGGWEDIRSSGGGSGVMSL